jgi:hypothetical protein
MINCTALTPELLRTHVAKGAHLITGVRQLLILVRQSSKTEICHPQLAAAIDQQVRRLDVAMNHSSLVGVIERIGGLNCPPDDGTPVSSASGR